MDEAESKLLDKQPGTFLSRFSTQPGQITISVATETRIIHSRFNYTKLLFGVELESAGEKFYHFNALIARYPEYYHTPVYRNGEPQPQQQTYLNAFEPRY
jgi:hypothetical protein